MLVSNLLLSKKKLTTVSPYESIKSALELIKKNNTLSIPVCVGDDFYGSISKSSIYEFLSEKNEDKDELLSKIKVENLIRKDIPIIRPNGKLEDVIPLLEKGHIPFIAVVDKYKKFHGIITYKVIFQQFTEILGINQGKRISVITHESKGQLSKITKIVAQNGGNLISAVVINPRSAFNLREIILRVKTDNFDVILKKLKEAGFNVEA